MRGFKKKINFPCFQGCHFLLALSPVLGPEGVMHSLLGDGLL